MNTHSEVINTKEEIEFNIHIKKVALYLATKLKLSNIELIID